MHEDQSKITNKRKFVNDNFTESKFKKIIHKKSDYISHVKQPPEQMQVINDVNNLKENIVEFDGNDIDDQHSFNLDHDQFEQHLEQNVIDDDGGVGDRRDEEFDDEDEEAFDEHISDDSNGENDYEVM